METHEQVLERINILGDMIIDTRRTFYIYDNLNKSEKRKEISKKPCSQ